MLTNYTNHVDYLSKVYEINKAECYYFSYEYVAMKIGIKSRGNVYKIFKGERSISVPVAIRLSKVLGHNHLETDYFITMVLLANCRSNIEREFLECKLADLREIMDPAMAI